VTDRIRTVGFTDYFQHGNHEERSGMVIQPYPLFTDFVFLFMYSPLF